MKEERRMEVQSAPEFTMTYEGIKYVLQSVAVTIESEDGKPVKIIEEHTVLSSKKL